MEINTQFANFLITLLLGFLLGVIFDFYRVMRGVFRFKALTTFLFDGLYWLVALAITFSCLLFSNWVELRFYLLIGLVGGALFYFRMLSKYIIFVIIRGVKAASAAYIWLKKSMNTCVVRPVGYLLGVFFLPFRFAVKKTNTARRKAGNWRIFRKKIKKAEEEEAK